MCAQEPDGGFDDALPPRAADDVQFSLRLWLTRNDPSTNPRTVQSRLKQLLQHRMQFICSALSSIPSPQLLQLSTFSLVSSARLRGVVDRNLLSATHRPWAQASPRATKALWASKAQGASGPMGPKCPRDTRDKRDTGFAKCTGDTRATSASQTTKATRT